VQGRGLGLFTLGEEVWGKPAKLPLEERKIAPFVFQKWTSSVLFPIFKVEKNGEKEDQATLFKCEEGEGGAKGGGRIPETYVRFFVDGRKTCRRLNDGKKCFWGEGQPLAKGKVGLPRVETTVKECDGVNNIRKRNLGWGAYFVIARQRKEACAILRSVIRIRSDWTPIWKNGRPLLLRWKRG